MPNPSSEKKSTRRGRPPKVFANGELTRGAIVRRGTEMLTECGFLSVSLEHLLSRAGVPKGSFYYYFRSKDDFGCAAIENYAIYFSRKLGRLFLDRSNPPLDRLRSFAEEAKAAMIRYDFRRGCLLGNLGQEVVLLNPEMRNRIRDTFEDWEMRLARLLEEAVGDGSIPADVNTLSSAMFFWTGWEGAVMRARLSRSVLPLDLFLSTYLGTLRTAVTPEPISRSVETNV